MLYFVVVAKLAVYSFCTFVFQSLKMLQLKCVLTHVSFCLLPVKIWEKFQKILTKVKKLLISHCKFNRNALQFYLPAFTRHHLLFFGWSQLSAFGLFSLPSSPPPNVPSNKSADQAAFAE